MAVLGGRAGRAARGALPLCAALLLAGCAAMPSNGEVRKVDEGPQPDGDSQVHVAGIAPHTGESPQQIVSGFLEATTSGEPDFSTAKKYLTADLMKRWDPFARITVLSKGPYHPSEGTDAEATSTTVALSGSKEALVDAGHAYQPDQGPLDTDVHLVRQGGEWRIDRMGDGLILSASDFERIYHSVNMYYFADLGADERHSGARRETLIADPVYLPWQSPDGLLATVKALLKGPSKWLAPAVSSAAPAGVDLTGGAEAVTLDDSQRLKVRLKAKADQLRGEECVRLAAQIFTTVQGQASVKLDSVEVQRADGATACTLGNEQARQYGPANLVGASDDQYYIGSAQHNLLVIPPDGTTAQPVSGPFGAAKADLRSVAVRRDGQVAAGVKSDGRQLVVGALTDGDVLQTAPLTSAAQDPKNGLSAPSWDGFDDLWVADRNSAVSKLYVLRGGVGQPVPVTVPGLQGRVESLRVASDGVRIALVVSEAGAERLELGWIDRGGTAEQPQFSVEGLRDITPAGENVVSASWAGASRLVLVGSDPDGGGQQIRYVGTDGSPAPALATVGEPESVAASEDQSKPLLVLSGGNVYSLTDDSNGKKVSPKGDSPVYPG